MPHPAGAADPVLGSLMSRTDGLRAFARVTDLALDAAGNPRHAVVERLAGAPGVWEPWRWGRASTCRRCA